MKTISCDHLPGRLREICSGGGDLRPDKRLAYLRQMFPDESTETLVAHLQMQQLGVDRIRQNGVVPAGRHYTEPVGTFLKEEIARLAEIRPSTTCKCQSLADQMDRWGIAGCESHRGEIVEQLVEHKQMLIEALQADQHKSVMQRLVLLANASLPDRLIKAACRRGANYLLNRAIDKTREFVAREKKRLEKRPKPGGGLGSCFKHQGGAIRLVRSADFQEDIKTLIGKIPPDITAIAGVARSGLSAATMLSMYLHLPMITIRQTKGDWVETGNGWRLGGSRHVDPKTQKILVVDDTCMTGNSLKAIRPLLEQHFPNVITSTVYCNPLALVKPDIWAVDLGWPHILEWNMFNSILSPTMALDFDGIMCQDCEPQQDDDGPRYLDFIRNAKPLYTPRRNPVPLIVTARIEKYREATMEWLARHSIRANRLVMHPAATLAERNRDDIPAYKARHFSEWARSGNRLGSVGPFMFVESEDWQARRIGAISKMLCVCPRTGGVYS